MKYCKCGNEVPDSFWFCPKCGRVFQISLNEYNKRECPECGAPTVQQEGCEQCFSCGWSKC